MNLADVFTVVLVILGLMLLFIGIWLMAAGLFPAKVAACAEQLGESPLRCGLVGGLSVAPLLGLGLYLGKIAPNAPVKILSGLVITATILAALFGTAGLALRIGQGMASVRDQAEPWRRVLRGGVVLAITYLSLVLLPLTLLVGFGALVLAQWPRRRSGILAEPKAL